MFFRKRTECDSHKQHEDLSITRNFVLYIIFLGMEKSDKSVKSISFNEFLMNNHLHRTERNTYEGELSQEGEFYRKLPQSRFRSYFYKDLIKWHIYLHRKINF